MKNTKNNYIQLIFMGYHFYVFLKSFFWVVDFFQFSRLFGFKLRLFQNLEKK